MIRGIILFIAICWSHLGWTQYHQSVFSDLDGDALFEALVRDYKTTTVLSYRNARDTFMGKIDLVDDKLTCVYSGYEISLDPDEDPSTQAFNQNVNTEHVYPRSMGPKEGTLAYSDMHHLFPCRADVNTARGNLPLKESNDNLTDKWYLYNFSTPEIPEENIDAYSEYQANVAFEPRESMKGDLARAYFYVRTVYRVETDREAPEFFDSQVEDLCAWHILDPVDDMEWNRNALIAQYQEKPNPFILDCSLARLYCPEVDASCITSDTEDVEDDVYLYPNPTRGILMLEMHRFSKVKVYNLSGEIVKVIKATSGSDTIDISDLNHGRYVLMAEDEDGKVKLKRIIEKR